MVDGGERKKGRGASFQHYQQLCTTVGGRKANQSIQHSVVPLKAVCTLPFGPGTLATHSIRYIILSPRSFTLTLYSSHLAYAIKGAEARFELGDLASLTLGQTGSSRTLDFATAHKLKVNTQRSLRAAYTAAYILFRRL
jgi:hypothetical protein